MRSHYRRLFAAALALSLAGLGLTACGEDTGPGGGETTREQDDTKPPPTNGDIVHANEDCKKGTQETCYPTQSYGTEYTMRAKVIDGDGNPAEQRVVNFEIVEKSAPDVLSLGSKRKVTKESGVAENTFTTGESGGTATVRAFTNEEKLGEIKWEVEVAAKGGGGYEVNVTYDGEAEVNETKVALFPAETTCDDLQSKWAIRRQPNFDRSMLPTSITSQREPLNPASNNTFERTFNFETPIIETGKAYTVAARSFKLKQPMSEPDVEVAWGCKTGEKLAELSTVTVDIPLQDRIPILKQKYEVTHHFDLVKALPDSVERWVRLFGLLVKSPGAFLVGCKPGDKSVNRDGTQVELCPEGEVKGLLDVFSNSDIIPENVKGWIEDLLDSGLGRETIRETIDKFIVNNVYKNVGWADAARKITDDIFSSLTNFGVKGPMRFENQPMPTYKNGEAVLHIEDGASQTWHEFAFYWRYEENCMQSNDFNSCRTKWFKTSEFMSGDDTLIEGDFRATLAGINDLDIENHSLTFDFGALMIGLLEYVVLPRYFSSTVGGSNVVKDVDDNGDGVVTFDELLGGTLVQCTGIAQTEPIGDGEDDGVDSTIETAVFKLCDNLRSKLVDELKDVITENLKVDKSQVTIGSPDGEPCTIHQPDTYPNAWPNSPLPFVDRLGTKDAQCDWDVKFSFADDKVPGKFWGTSD